MSSAGAHEIGPDPGMRQVARKNGVRGVARRPPPTGSRPRRAIVEEVVDDLHRARCQQAHEGRDVAPSYGGSPSTRAYRPDAARTRASSARRCLCRRSAGSRPCSPPGASAIVVEVGSKSPSSAAPPGSRSRAGVRRLRATRTGRAELVARGRHARGVLARRAPGHVHRGRVAAQCPEVVPVRSASFRRVSPVADRPGIIRRTPG